MTAAVLAQD